MSAEDTLRRNKTDILEILCSDRVLILNKVQQKSLITRREYNNLQNITKENDEGHVVALVDKIMNKGEKTCQDFLNLLQTDGDIKSTFPKLRNLQLHGAGPLPRPVQVSSAHSEVSLGPDNKRPKMDRVYPLNSQPVGLCLIINNVNFTSPNHKVRNGSDKDAQSLAEVFSELGFRVLMCKNQTKDQMEKTLTWFSSLTDPALPPQEFRVEEWSDTGFTDPHQPLNHGDAFICCLLSHGVEGAVLGTDGSPLSIQRITTTFTEHSALKGKPKVFLIQACQGKERQRRVWVDDLEEDSFISVGTDILIAISTVEDYVSIRNPKYGSWFIQSVCQQLRECCPRGEDLLTILTYVNNDVSQKEGSDQRPGTVKQMSEVTHTLRKKLVFSLHHT